MKLDRIMIAAPKSGSGKTTITCAILQILKEQGEKVAAYKCGPDYIDPMFHKTVLGIESKNLDTFFSDEEQTRALFLEGRTERGISVLEGVMGLYDGLGGICEEGSSYHLAKVTKTPIVLVVDAKGMGRSVTALLAGFLSYDTEKLIKGVIFNRMTQAYYERIAPIVKKELGLIPLGCFPEQKLSIPSRHLGLYLPDELSEIRTQIKSAAQKLCTTCSVEQLREIARGAEELESPFRKQREEKGRTEAFPAKTRSVIAVAKDEAFCFYYEDNLALLEHYGAKLHYFSPLHDKELPKHCSAVLLGGGYPELYAKKLSENASMRGAVREAFAQKMPMVAECGGFLYLHESLQCRDGKVYPMAGVLSGSCMDRKKLVRFGYVEIREKKSRFLPEGESIKGHEFHYFDSSDNGKACMARKPVSEKEYSCILEGGHYWFGFPHLYYPSNPHFAQAFVEMAKRFSDERYGKFYEKKIDNEKILY